MTRPARSRVFLAAFLVLVVAAALTLVGCLAAGSGPGHPKEKKVIGYVTYWDQQRGFDTVRRQLGLFDEVSPFWYSLDATGRIVPTDDDNTTVDRATVRFLQQRGIKVVPTVTNLRNGDWDPAVVRTVLHDSARLRAHVDDIVQLATTEGYDGIDLDYEDLRAADRDAYSAFLRELSGALHARGKLLTSSVHPKTSDAGDDERNVAQDYRAIGAAVDRCA